MIQKIVSKIKINLAKKKAINTFNLTRNSFYGNLSIFATLIISLLVISLRNEGKLQQLELLAYDKLIQLKKTGLQDDRLLLVEITEKDIKNQSRWPLSDATLAQLLDQLQKYQPTAIGLDIYRDIPHPPGTSRLKQELQQDNVVVIKYIGNNNEGIAAPIGVNEEQIGFNDVVLDIDSKLRRSIVYAQLGDEKLYSFALRLSLAYLKNNFSDKDFELTADNNALYIGNARFKRLQPNSGGYQMELQEALGWQFLIDYQSPTGVAPKISLTEVLKGNFDPNLVKNKVVIIGTTAPSINDYFYTPYGREQTDIPGVTIHAQVVSQIIALALGESSQVWFFPEALEYAWIALWGAIVLAIALKWKNPVIIIVAGIFTIVSLLIICGVSFFIGGWIPLIPAVLNLGLTLFALLFQRVVYSYFYDSLTGLPNETLFVKKLQNLRQKNLKCQSKLIVVLCIDLNRFKMINHALGYQAGDKLLIITAEGLRNSLGKKAIFARVGGDEFAIAKLVPDKATALQFIDRLQQDLNIPFEFQNIKTFTNITAGIAFYTIENDFNPDKILRSARTAMYQAKASGKATHQFFANKMHEQALKRLQLEADLYQAIEKQEFELYYQPIIDLKTEKLAGFESLIRWNSPSRGFISPGVFIPIAEETGAIIPIGEWVLKEACNQMYQWQQQFSKISSLFISVNLSGRQFTQKNLVTIINNILQSSGLKSSCLKLEITESMVMENIHEAILMLNNLKSLGIKLSLDDFGTGFSSFSYLHRFPMDTLKVDRSFVSNMNQGNKNFEIVSSIVLLSHKLGMDVIAEGIETELEKVILQSLDCGYGQGYLFAKPLPVAEVTNLFNHYNL